LCAMRQELELTDRLGLLVLDENRLYEDSQVRDDGQEGRLNKGSSRAGCVLLTSPSA
jgi:hypothetical protein